jgi:hypothetical protein
MKDVIKDIIKWGAIIVIGAVAFYVVYPKYEVALYHSAGTAPLLYRYNKLIGTTEVLYKEGGASLFENTWETVGVK